MFWLPDPRVPFTEAIEGVFRGFTNADVHLDTAQKILREAEDGALRRFLSDVTTRIKDAVGETEANNVLETASSIFCKATGTVVQTVLFNLIRCTLMAIGQNDFAQALVIWQGIFTNDANQATLAFVLQNIYSLADFLIGLIEPAKCYATALSTDGTPDNQNPHAQYDRYNELNLAIAMNRHTLITQLQRLAKSLSHIFLVGNQNTSLDQLPMDTSLRSDFDHNGNVVIPPAITIGPDQKGHRHSKHGEQWLFVNGISGELYWLRLYCEKLANIFQRDIRGVFNRSDGILWDLVECAGERDVAGEREIDGRQNTIIQRTPSSMEAQMALNNELSTALENNGAKSYIVMIAYSQGCLLLRKVLQNFVENDMYREAMQKRLRVFTFGNPSIDWMSMNSEGEDVRICDHVNLTEHFANKSDFVAQLGVLKNAAPETLRDLGFLYDNSSLFINHGNDWIGHLFGTQYSLRPQEYQDGTNSSLLACAGGMAMV